MGKMSLGCLSNIELYHDIIDCLVGALEAKDLYTSGHSRRVADMSYDLAKLLGIRGKELDDIHMATHVHDIGKIGVPDYILNKAEKLSEHEWAYIKKHPEIGSNILDCSKTLKDISIIVLYHHERWDGGGYPLGLKFTDIPLGSRIISICDSIDAMTSQRAYRKALSWEECRQEIEINSGLQFDPKLVNATNQLWSTWTNYRNNKK